MPLLGGKKGSRALTGIGAQMGNGSGSGSGEVRKAERQDWSGDNRGAESPSYRQGGRKAKCRLDSHDHCNNRISHVASPHPIGRSAHVTPRPDLSGDALDGKRSQKP
jgi:hypothetical protein